MTDKVRIDTLSADLLDANNETFFGPSGLNSNRTSGVTRASCLWLSQKAEGVWLTDADNKQYLDCLAGAGTPRSWSQTTLMCCKASKVSLPAACRYIPSI
ncbi:diaminobutyrate--2-oxoglutarate aminotransferase [Raoultella planticola]|uniref:Diaminobutyrate--2-oxoglutarate aminotransferase n=1 Tax=Raoultella planticola TaxID=575 RepID=A0A485CVS1_RAOPL|nr:diaminobutyrate--2-oxoglutarate aminotransferase [Raoultella planticola]